MTENFEKFMTYAINEAKKCDISKDVPVGAVIVKDGKIIAKAHNEKEKNKCAIYHAEIIAIKKASKKLNSYRLDDCDIYITKEPCLMCMGAILSARMRRIIFGAKDKRFGTIDLAGSNNFNHKCEVVSGVLEKECEQILTHFFQNLRGKNEST